MLNCQSNLAMAKLWFVSSIYPLLLALVLAYIPGLPSVIDLIMVAVLGSIACLGAASTAYSNYVSSKNSLESKLKALDEKDVVFAAGYKGFGEIFTAEMPDGTFIDYGHWMGTGRSDRFQYFKPSDFQRVVDETLEYVEDYNPEILEYKEANN